VTECIANPFKTWGKIAMLRMENSWLKASSESLPWTIMLIRTLTGTRGSTFETCGGISKLGILGQLVSFKKQKQSQFSKYNLQR